MNTKFYVRDDVRQHYLSVIDEVSIKKDDEIDIVSIPQAVVYIDCISSKCGVFDKDNKFCTNSARQRYGRTRSIPPIPKNTDNIPFVNQDVIFAGFGLTFHFGHFLIEGMSRMWPALNKKFANHKFVFVEKEAKALPKYVYRFMKLIGVPQENIIVISKTTRFRSVTIPSQSVDIGKFSSQLMGDIYNKISSNSLPPPADFVNIDKVYLTRTAMGDRRTFGEEQIQNIFVKNGFTVISPEKLSLDAQIQLMKNASVVAGLAGTALHLAAFMKPGTTLIQIKRNLVPSDNFPVQYLINKIQDVNLVMIDGSIEQKPTPHFTAQPQIVGVTEYLKGFFDDNGFEYSESDLITTKKELKEYRFATYKYRIAKAYKKSTQPILRLIALLGITKRNRRYILHKLELLFYRQ